MIGNPAVSAATTTTANGATHPAVVFAPLKVKTAQTMVCLHTLALAVLT